MLRGAPARIGQRLRSFVLQALEIGAQGLGHGKRSGQCHWFSGLGRDFARPILSLMEIEDGDAIGAQAIVSLRDRLDGIFLVAEIAAQNPFAARQAFAIPEMRPFAEAAPIRLSGRLELRARRGAVECSCPGLFST